MLHRMRRRAAGFTLIELLIVIGIIVILSVVVVLTLNPAELLRQSRDSRRVSDMATVQSAIALYIVDVTSPNIVSSSANCYIYTGTTSTANCGGRFTSATLASSSSLLPNGSGYIPIDFTGVSTGAPIANLPLDPTNDGNYYFAYRGSSTNLVYELNANLESTKYTSGSGNLENTDGGNNSAIYEVGTDPGLDM